MNDISFEQERTPSPVPPAKPRVNRLVDHAAWTAAREACRRDPGGFHGAIARRNLHWHDHTHLLITAHEIIERGTRQGGTCSLSDSWI